MISRNCVLVAAMAVAGGVAPWMRTDCVWAQEAGADAAEQATKKVRETFAEIGKEMGNLTLDEQKKVDALVAELGQQYKAQPATMPKSRDDFFGKVLPRFRATLNAAHQAQFDAMMKKQAGQQDAILKSVKLHQLGTNAVIYAEEHKGMLPATLDDLAPGEDFVWLGSKRNLRELNASFVLAHLKPKQPTEGNSFLLVDGSVQSFDAAKSTAILAELKAGRNPPSEMKKANASETKPSVARPAEKTKPTPSKARTPSEQKSLDHAEAVFLRAAESPSFFSHQPQANNHYPPTLGDGLASCGLLTTPSLKPKSFLLPGPKGSLAKVPSDWNRPDKWPLQAKIDWINKNSDYVYLASDDRKTHEFPLTFILLHTKPEALGGACFFMLNRHDWFFCEAEQSAKIIAEIKEGKNPSPTLDQIAKDKLDNAATPTPPHKTTPFPRRK